MEEVNKDSLDINNESDVNRIMKYINDQSMEWAFGQGTKPGAEREMVSRSFIEGAKMVISLLQGGDMVCDCFISPHQYHENGIWYCDGCYGKIK